MALKKWHKLPVNQRRSEGDRWNELVDEVNSNSDILENAVDNDTIYDDTDIKAKMGYSNIPNNTNLQEEIDAITVPTKVSDLDNDSGFLTSHQDITGKADANHVHTVSQITDFPNIEFIKIVTDKGTASADTMDKLYIEVINGSFDLYFSVEDNGSYSWESADAAILDNLSIGWNDVENKPSTFAPSSHTHTESDISDLGDYIEKSSTSGLVKNDGTIDTSVYLTQHQDISGKADSNHSHTLSNITDLTTVEAVITYTDNSTETVLLVKQVVSNEP